MYRPRDRSNEWFYRQTCRFLVFLQVCLICICATKRQKHTHCKNRHESWRVYTIRALLINTRDSITQMPMMINDLSTLWPTTGIWTCLTVIALGPCWIKYMHQSQNGGQMCYPAKHSKPHSGCQQDVGFLDTSLHDPCAGQNP